MLLAVVQVSLVSVWSVEGSVTPSTDRHSMISFRTTVNECSHAIDEDVVLLLTVVEKHHVDMVLTIITIMVLS